MPSGYDGKKNDPICQSAQHRQSNQISLAPIETIFVVLVTIARCIEVSIATRRPYAIELSRALPANLDVGSRDVLLCEAISPECDLYTVSESTLENIARLKEPSFSQELRFYLMSFRSISGTQLLDGCGLEEAFAICENCKHLHEIVSYAASLHEEDFCKAKTLSRNDLVIDKLVEMLVSERTEIVVDSVRDAIKFFASELCGPSAEDVRSMVVHASLREGADTFKYQ